MSITHSSHSSPRHLSVHGRIVTQNSTLSRELLHRTGSNLSKSGATSPTAKHSVSVSALDVVEPNSPVSKCTSNNALNIADSGRSNSKPTLPVLESNISQEANTVANTRPSLQKESSRSNQSSSVGNIHSTGSTGLDSSSYTQLKNRETEVRIKSNSSLCVSGGGDIVLTSDGNARQLEDQQITLHYANSSDNFNPNSYEYNRLKSRNKNLQAPANDTLHIVDNRSDVQLLNVGLTNSHQRSLTQQFTGLSLHSKTVHNPPNNNPNSVHDDENLTTIPPLDLRNLTPSPGSETDDSIGLNYYSEPSSYHQQALGLKQFDSETFSNLNAFDKSTKPNFPSSANFRQFDAAEQDTYRDRQADPEQLEVNRSDLADDLTVPFPFDTQALTDNTNRGANPPSPPVQTTPPPEKEPVTSLRASSQVYAVSNPDIQRAQETSQHRQASSKSGSQEVKFSGGSQQPVHRDHQDRDLQDRAPTPYARSPKKELPPTPPDWEPPREATQKTTSAKSKGSLPPQHPPLDTLHTPKPESREKLENSQIKRVYVESPSFTKEEEEEYRFVSSRLEDIEEKNTTTFREMDPNRRGYGGDDYQAGSNGEARSRKTESGKAGQSKNRYEDRNKRTVNKEKDRYEDRSEEMNGYSDLKSKNNRRVGSYKSGDGYDRLKQDRAELDREPRREDETNLRGLKKQNTEMDERDLRLEAEYQRDLKRRIDSNKVKDIDPRYARRESYDKENDTPRDSLEYPEDQAGYARDSLDYNGFEQQERWGNPPSNPYQDDMRYYQMELAKQDSKPDFYDADDVERMDIVNPKAPKYDYIENNKQDYGMLPRKTYRDIEHKKKEEEEKLDHIFITPKLPPKSKHGSTKKAQSAQPQHMGYQPPEQFPMGFKPSSAEELWAKKAAHLSDKKDSAQGNKPSRELPGRSGPKRWNSNPQVKQAQRFVPPAPLPNQGQIYKPQNVYQPNQHADEGGYSQNHGSYGTPMRLQPIENKPAPPVATELQPTAVKPSSPFRRHMELKPITQEITTEDGQRISVDINLRLISPPPGHSGAGSPHHQQQLALMPVQDTQPPGDHRGYGVPYQMQDQYQQYDYGYNNDAGQYGYSGADQMMMVPYTGEQRLSQAELELADPSGYSRKFQSYKDDEISNSELKSLEEGYAALYHKMKTKDPSEHPWYKVYNINDYKKMQREVRLNRGTLGPDLDTESYKDKMEKRHKQFEYARMVMEKNRMELGVKKPPKFPKQPEKQGEEGVKRKTALEYAKNVPKPQTKPRPNQYNSYEVAAQLTPGSPTNKRVNLSKHDNPQGSTQTMDVIDIRTLEQRHLQERRTADKIRQNMDSVLTQKAH